MIDGFTLAYGHDRLALYCDACGDDSEPVVEEVTDTAALAPLIDAAREHRRTVHPPPLVDRGRDSSRALTEVRTVLSRAETALGAFNEQGTEWEHGRTDGEWWERWYRDPDHDAMVAALDKVVRLLSCWRRTGRPRKASS